MVMPKNSKNRTESTMEIKRQERKFAPNILDFKVDHIQIY